MEQLSKSCDLVIIGAGCIGSFSAFYASKNQLSIVVLEEQAGTVSRTSNRNCGIIHAGHNVAPNTLKAKLVDIGNQRIKELSKELGFELIGCGELVVAQSESENAQLDEMLKYCGLINLDARIVEDNELFEIEPGLNGSIRRAIFVPSAAVVDPFQMSQAALKTAMANGVQVLTGQKVTSMTRTGDRIAVNTQTLQITARAVINAAGLHADDVAKMLNPATKIKIEARKGTICVMSAPLVKTLVFPLPGRLSKGCLAVPTVTGCTLAGPTVDVTESKTDWQPTEESRRLALAGFNRLVGGAVEENVIRTVAGLRAVSSDEDFVIENVLGNFVSVGGTQSPGLTCSAVLGEMVAGIVAASLGAEANEGWAVQRLDDGEGLQGSALAK